MSRQEPEYNQFMRERIRQAREEAGFRQEELAQLLNKTRVAISDLERGRVDVNAAELVIIAMYLKKPITYFFPPLPNLIVTSEVSPLEQELLLHIRALPEIQQYIALEYIRQQHELVKMAMERIEALSKQEDDEPEEDS